MYLPNFGSIAQLKKVLKSHIFLRNIEQLKKHMPEWQKQMEYGTVCLPCWQKDAENNWRKYMITLADVREKKQDAPIILCCVQKISNDIILIKESESSAEKADEKISISDVEAMRYAKLLDAADFITFICDIDKKSIQYSENFQKKIGLPPPASFEEVYRQARERIHPDDLETYNMQMSNLKNAIIAPHTEYRCKRADGRYVWHQRRLTVIYDEYGRPSKILGIIIDVNHYMVEYEKLEVKAQTDPLTSLLNKSATEENIKQCLIKEYSGQKHALLLVDIDNFKNINDSFGHLVGDEILRRIAHIISSEFREDDIVGRIGGDEFLILLRNVPNMSIIESKARLLLNAFSKEMIGNSRLSASIGIAVYSEHGKNFQKLFHKADMALYAAKQQGKDQWRIYGHSTEEDPNIIKSQVQPDYTKESRLVDSHFMNQVYQILYETENEKDAMNEILELTGKQLCLHHIYVYDMDGRCRLLDWYSNASVKQRNYKSVLSLQAREEFQEMLREEGLVICTDMKECTGISASVAKFLAGMGVTALLQVPILLEGKISGILGFSMNDGPRHWTKTETSIACFLARIVSITYLNKISLQNLKRKTTIYSKLFEQIDVIGYIIDETFTIIKCNVKMVQAFPVNSGQKCYKLIHGRNSSCPHCPVLKLNKACREYVSEAYLPNYINPFRITAKEQEWENHERVFLITCTEMRKV